MIVSMLLKRTACIQRCASLKKISTSSPNRLDSDVSRDHDYFPVISTPAAKMNVLKLHQKFQTLIVSAGCLTSAVSLTLWQLYEPTSFGTYSQYAGVASVVVTYGLFGQYITSKVIGRVTLNTESGKLIVSHLDPFGNRLDKHFNASQCHFQFRNHIGVCYLPDGKYITISRHSSPEEKELLLSMTANQPVSTSRKGLVKNRSHVYYLLVLYISIGLNFLLSCRTTSKMAKEQQLQSVEL